MSIKEKILLDINEIKNPTILKQVFEFLQTLKESDAFSREESNGSEFWKSVGVLSDEDAKELTQIIDTEFNNIEGDW